MIGRITAVFATVLAATLFAFGPQALAQSGKGTAKQSASARKAHDQILKAYGLYENQALQDYVSQVGQRVAKQEVLLSGESDRESRFNCVRLEPRWPGRLDV